MEKNNIIPFDTVVDIVEKAMDLGYPISYDGHYNEICVKKDGDWIQFNVTFRVTDDIVFLSCMTSNFGYTKIKISKKELAIFNLLLERVKEYNEVQLVKMVNDFFPKVEERKAVTINDLDDEND